MGHIIIVGAGPVGLTTALLLALDNHRVTVIDQDPEPPSDTPDGVWQQWKRPGVTQFAAPHALAPIGYLTLEREIPEVVSEVLRLGGLQLNMIAGALQVLPGGREHPDDDRFDTVAARRPVLEAAFYAVARRSPFIDLRRGVRVVGVQSAGTPAGNGWVRVALENGEQVQGDLVVDACGRRGLGAIRARPSTAAGASNGATDRGFRYYTRHFRGVHGRLPAPAPWPLHHYDSVSTIVVPGDNGTWSATLVTSGADQELRPLGRSYTWQKAASLYQGLAPWVNGEPISPVVAVGGLRSIRGPRHAAPLPLGVVAVGDAWATTNPQFGLGMSLGILHAVLLRDALRETGMGHPADLATLLGKRTEKSLGRTWNDLARWEKHRQAEIQADMRGVEYRSEDVFWIEHIAARASCLRDAAVLRSMADIGFLLADPRTDSSTQDEQAPQSTPMAGVLLDTRGPCRQDLTAVVSGRE